MKTTTELMDRIGAHIPKMQGWCEVIKAQKIANLILSLKPEISVELGVFGGRGVIAMAMTHEFLGKGMAWGFDPWEKGATLEGVTTPEDAKWWSELDIEGIYKGFVGEVIAHNLLSHLNWARIRSDQAYKLFEDGSIGVLHADSNHSELISCGEVENWHKKVKVGGYWISDDIDWLTVWKAQDLLMEKGFEIRENHTKWAVYQKVKDVS